MDAHCARKEDVADATALGARISRARFFDFGRSPTVPGKAKYMVSR